MALRVGAMALRVGATAGRYRSELLEVEGDMHRHTPHALVEGPGRGVERVGPAGPDGDDLEVLLSHVGEGILAQGSADIDAPVSRRHGEDDDIAVAAGRVDRSVNVAGDG